MEYAALQPNLITLEIMMFSSMYEKYADYYDQLYTSKDYEKEILFLHNLLSQHKVKNLLDVGCGTGTHLSLLEQLGYQCEGLDFNKEMVDLAKKKMKGRVFQGDMRNFDSHNQYEAIISMFAVFNHNLLITDAISTLKQCKKHLKARGILILDLYNPQSSGEKINSFHDITRSMKWEIDSEKQYCQSLITFSQGNHQDEEKFILKIFSIPVLQQLLEQSGFNEVKFYDNYTLNEGSSKSKNLIILAR